MASSAAQSVWQKIFTLDRLNFSQGMHQCQTDHLTNNLELRPKFMGRNLLQQKKFSKPAFPVEILAQFHIIQSSDKADMEKVYD